MCVSSVAQCVSVVTPVRKSSSTCMGLVLWEWWYVNRALLGNGESLCYVESYYGNGAMGLVLS